MRAYSSPFQTPPNKAPKPLSARPQITGLWPVFRHVRVIFSKVLRISSRILRATKLVKAIAQVGQGDRPTWSG